jgi:hypothetical protein
MGTGSGTGSEVAKASLVGVGNWAVRHAPTLALIFGAIWFIGKPHIDTYITTAVAGSFEEQKKLIANNKNAINNLSTEQRANTTELGNVKEALEELTESNTANREASDEILQLLRQNLNQPPR